MERRSEDDAAHPETLARIQQLADRSLETVPPIVEQLRREMTRGLQGDKHVSIAVFDLSPIQAEIANRDLARHTHARVCARIASMLRHTDICGPLDEMTFVAILPNTSLTQAQEAMARIGGQSDRALRLAGRQIRWRLATMTAEDDDPSRLLARAAAPAALDAS